MAYNNGREDRKWRIWKDVYKRQHPDWWQDKKNPDRHGIRIPVLDENGNQKVGARNRKQWKREMCIRDSLMCGSRTGNR